MPIVSGGSTVSTTTWSAPYEWTGSGPHPLSQWLRGAMAYDEIYRRQLWPNVAINKLVNLHNQLPRKVYKRVPGGREDARDSPFGRLITSPSMALNSQHFWGWFKLQHHIHGIAFARKHRDRGGRPVRLELIHSTRMRYGPAGGGIVPSPDGRTGGPNRWWLNPAAGGPEVEIPRQDLLIWSRLDSVDPHCGLSPLEPLRETLENEHGSRRANAAMWRNGGKHSIVLRHPGRFNNPKVTEALRQQYADKYGGVENWGKPLVLQENMEAVVLTASENLEYIDTRKLNREEVAAELDLPPNSIGINDRSTFSNVTEQNRQIYRSNMPTHLQGLEAAIDHDLRDGRFGEDRDPDFGEAYYFESLVDGVMRGSFEERTQANAIAIQTGQLTMAESRERDNLPYIEGSDRLMTNAALVPISTDPDGGGDAEADPKALGELVQKLYLGTPDKYVLTTEEARQIMNQAGAGLDLTVGGNTSAALVGDVQSVVMGRLARFEELAEIDPARLVEGLDERARTLVLAALHRIGEDGASVPELRNMIKQLLGDQR